MRIVLLAALTTLGGCFFFLDHDKDHRDPGEGFVVDSDHRAPQRPSHPRPPDTAPPPETHAPAETDALAETDAPSPCERADVRALLDALAEGSAASCAHGSVYVTATSADGHELQLQLYVDTIPEGDAPTEPYEVGQVFAADLAAGAPGGSARLVLGSGLALQACNDVAGEVTEDHTWIGVAGTVTYTVTDAHDAVQPWGEALFQADVRVEGVVVEDATGGRCTLPDTTWTHRWMGWLPG